MQKLDIEKNRTKKNEESERAYIQRTRNVRDMKEELVSIDDSLL
jgi:hypothetical protein